MTYSKTQLWQESKDYVGLIVGLTLYAIGFTTFILPYQITTGGLSGVSAIVFYATGFPVQYTYFLVNVGLLVAAIKVLGFKFCVKTIVGIVALTFEFGLFQELLEDSSGELPKILGDQTFMACVLGGLTEGIGLAVIFLTGGSTGGTDIVAAIIHKYRNISLGRILMFCDIAIVSSSYLVFHDLQKVVLGFCVLVISSVAIDYYMNSARQSVQFLIISEKYDEIAEAVSTQLDRGVTVLQGEGWYSKEPRHVLMVLARRREGVELFRLIQRIDPKAFVSQSNVVGVYGEGFDKIKVK